MHTYISESLCNLTDPRGSSQYKLMLSSQTLELRFQVSKNIE